MVALNSDDGTKVWVRSHEELSPQGYILASDIRLYVSIGQVRLRSTSLTAINWKVIVVPRRHIHTISG